MGSAASCPIDKLKRPAAGAEATSSQAQTEEEPESQADDGWQTFDVWSKTPLGKKTGKLRIKTEDGKLEGALTMLGSDSVLENGTIDSDGNFEWDFSLNTPIGLMEAHTTGTLKDGVVEAQAVSKNRYVRASHEVASRFKPLSIFLVKP